MLVVYQPGITSIEPKITANPAAQWFYSSVSKPSLQKTGILLMMRRDFWEYRRQKFDKWAFSETFDIVKSPLVAGLSSAKKKILRIADWLAGAGVDC